ncbi:MAG TPA: NAD(P)/FAD-dependent oxidoreductase [Burkholderiales bacterium]|nr:NAD(P)/FAD-dependent oxidoreductase [Burkholderiales bacterium]
MSALHDAMTETRCDVLVIGGGPAGSTISALLAQRGRDVVMLEKSRHPRFHIGESLLPFNMPLFEQLGVAREIEAIGMTKYGAEFVAPGHDKPVMFEFANAMDSPCPSAYQVRRSEFDDILFRNAARKGARAIEACRVTGVEFRAGDAAVTAREENGHERVWQTRFVVDASGRDTFLASRFGVKERNRENNSAAIYGHFAGATRLPGKSEGNISIFWFEHGWFWFIPLSDGANSIGAVCWPYYMKTRKTSPEQFLLDTIALCPALAERTREAKLISPVTATGNYSYSAGRAAGTNHIMLGDAFAFIDPIFSTGVFLAMHSAFVGADTVENCLDNPRGARRALKAYDANVHGGIRAFSWFIYRIMTPGLRDIFMNPGNQFQLRDALLSLLAGNAFRSGRLGMRLLALKALYYLMSANNLKASLMAWWTRRQARQEPGSETIAS